MPVPPLGLLQFGIPNDCAASGATMNAAAANAESMRIIDILHNVRTAVVSPPTTVVTALRKEVAPTKSIRVVLMHPHVANRHTVDGVAYGADSGMEPLRPAEIGAE